MIELMTPYDIMEKFTWVKLKKIIENTEGVNDQTEINYFDFANGRTPELEICLDDSVRTVIVVFLLH